MTEPQVQRPSKSFLKLMEALVVNGEDRYAGELCLAIGVASPTVLDCLGRMERWGWVSRREEDPEIAQRCHRRARRYYSLTATGRQEAQKCLDEHVNRRMKWWPLGEEW